MITIKKYIYSIIKFFLLAIYIPLMIIGIVIIPLNILQGMGEPLFVFRWFHFILIGSFYGITIFYVLGSLKTFKIINQFKKRAYLESETFTHFIYVRKCVGGIAMIGLINLPMFYVFADKADAPGLFLIAVILFGFIIFVYLFVIAYYQSLLEIKEYNKS